MSRGTLVLGIGNLLMGDEGVGVRAAEQLQRESWPPDVTVVDGGTGGFHLLEYLQEFSPIVMIDATMDGRPAGTVGVIRPKYASDFPRALTAHDIGLRDLVESAVLLGPLPDITLVTVSIVEIKSMVTTLSPEVEAALPAVAGLVRRLVADEPEAARHA
jgi:hydrogenase maturation protease